MMSKKIIVILSVIVILSIGISLSKADITDFNEVYFNVRFINCDTFEDITSVNNLLKAEICYASTNPADADKFFQSYLFFIDNENVKNMDLVNSYKWGIEEKCYYNSISNEVCPPPPKVGEDNTSACSWEYETIKICNNEYNWIVINNGNKINNTAFSLEPYSIPTKIETYYKLDFVRELFNMTNSTSWKFDIMLSDGSATSTLDPYWNTNWEYYTSINLNSTVTQNLTNFTYYIEVNTSQMILDGKLQADCQDLRFLDSLHSTEIDWEWDNYNTSSQNGCDTNNTGIWLLIPKLEGITYNGTIINMYYNNSLTSTFGNSSGYDYKAMVVYHMSDIINGNTTDAKNDNIASVEGGANHNTTGAFGNGFHFDGINDRLVIPHTSNIDIGQNVTLDYDDFMIECWFETGASGDPVFTKTSTGHYAIETYYVSDNYFNSYIYDGTNSPGIKIAGQFQAGELVHFSFTRNWTNKTLSVIYNDINNLTTDTIVGEINNSATAYIAYKPSSVSYGNYIIDEFVIYKGYHSQEWLLMRGDMQENILYSFDSEKSDTIIFSNSTIDTISFDTGDTARLFTNVVSADVSIIYFEITGINYTGSLLTGTTDDGLFKYDFTPATAGSYTWTKVYANNTDNVWNSTTVGTIITVTDVGEGGGGGGSSPVEAILEAILGEEKAGMISGFLLVEMFGIPLIIWLMLALLIISQYDRWKKWLG